jgi:hypothetical protein
MDRSSVLATSTTRLLRTALGHPLSLNVSGAHTLFITDAMLLVDANRLVTGFLFPEAVGSTYRGAFRMAALGQ